MRLIDANAAKKALISWDENPTDEEIKYTIDKLPTIDAVPVVHGRWVFDRPNHYKCSECDAMWSGIVRFMNYCPNCGAKMDGGAE